MPVFHTKTIESILEPVAQQVSKLVILHEEAEDGNAMPDLARPVQVVKLAVDNLVKVGYETINNSEDAILKQDMPPALSRVEEASILLLEASQLLRADPYSAPARKKLIEGSRGILQGTSALLLSFDESEVRKIIRICKNVLEYLAITEVVETMEDLVTFVKNLSPVLTRMTKEVDAREKELTHQVHRDWLIRSLDQVKQLTPVLISGIKIYVTTKAQGSNAGVQEAQQNRDYMVQKMSNEIHEIIRVLQLTTYDEDEWDADDITIMKKAQNAIDGKMKQAQDWLVDTNALVGSSGERSLRQILDDALKVADRCTNAADHDAIVKTVGDIQSMADALAELRQQGKGNTPQAMSLARGIQQQLHDLQQKVNKAVANSEKSGIRRPAHTVLGKVEQAQRWLANPALDDKGLGEEATRLVVNEGRKIAQMLQGQKKADMMRLCDEVEILTNQLADLCRRGLGNGPQAKAIARNLSEKLHELKNRIQDALVNQVADDFIDISLPLKQLSEAAMAPFGSPNRDYNFADKARQFESHADKLARTAQSVASAGGCNNKKTVEALHATAAQANDLTPQVVKAARIVLLNPNNAASVEHFDLLKKQWTENMEKLRGLVDEATDTAAFIKATEEGILRDTERTEDAIKHTDQPGIVTHTSNIARRANRVLQVAQQEADNSEDPKFVDNVQTASHELRRTITPMVQNAKMVAQSPQDQVAGGKWRGANQQLIDGVRGVRQAVTVNPLEEFPPPPPEDFPPPPDLSQLHIAAAFSSPPPPAHTASPGFGFSPSPQSVKSPPLPEISPTQTAKSLPPTKTYMAEARVEVASAPITESSFAPRRVPDQYAPPIPPPPQESYTAAVSSYGQQNTPPAPAIPPPPSLSSLGYSSDHMDYHAPPRPPLPRDTAPPRPPPPETDDEEEFPVPQANQPIMMAAHALHMDVKQWSSRDNEIIGAAKRMALLMAKLSHLVRGEGGSKKDLIAVAKAIAEASEEVTRLAKELARECTDKRMRTNLLQVCERIPTIGTQLKILSTVKATMLGAQELLAQSKLVDVRQMKPIPSPDGSEIVCGSEEDQEATEMLVGNAQNLMQSVRETVRAAEAASIKIRVDSGYSIRWVRKRPWYT